MGLIKHTQLILVVYVQRWKGGWEDPPPPVTSYSTQNSEVPSHSLNHSSPPGNLTTNIELGREDPVDNVDNPTSSFCSLPLTV